MTGADAHDQQDWLSLLIGIGGLIGIVYTIISHRWNKRESRLDALTRVLDPMVRAAQNLHKANDARRACEALKASYPNPERAPDAVARFNQLHEEYGKLLAAAEAEFRTSEAALASRGFRFPDAIRDRLKETHRTLGDFGRLVNDGLFGKADLHFARFSDQYKHLTRWARGWRLADPLEGIRRRFWQERQSEPPQSAFELTQEDAEHLLALVHKRATSQAHNPFVVHPPKVLIDDPSILESDHVVDRLKDHVFSLVFQDGTAQILGLHELVFFTANLIVLEQQTAELNRMVQAAQPRGPRKFEISFLFPIDEMMQPEMVKTILRAIEFSEVASDG